MPVNSLKQLKADSPFRIGDEVIHVERGPAVVVRPSSFFSIVQFPNGDQAHVANASLNIVKLFKAANDNAPALLQLQKDHGGEIVNGVLRGARIGGVARDIAMVDGEPWFLTPGGAPFARLPASEPPAALNFINPADWHGQSIPPRQWYSDGLIPMRQVTILNGDGGVGKSLLALQIAACGAMSVDTLNLAPWAGRTLYIGAEDEAEEFHRRLADIVTAHGHELDHLCMFRLLSLADTDALLSIPDKTGNMRHTPLWEKIVEFACEFRPRLVVLDTAADLYGGDEIKRPQVRQFIAMLRQLAIGLDCAVVLLAHPSVQGMQSGTGSSGSTAWNNSVRSRLYLTVDKDDPDLRILKTMKSNYGKMGDEVRLRWKDGVFVLDDGKPLAGEMLLAAKADRVFCDLLSMLNRQGRNVCHVPGTTYAPAVMAKLQEAEGVTKSRLVDAMNRLLTSGEIKIVVDGPASRQRQRLILAREDFGPE